MCIVLHLSPGLFHLLQAGRLRQAGVRQWAGCRFVGMVVGCALSVLVGLWQDRRSVVPSWRTAHSMPSAPRTLGLFPVAAPGADGTCELLHTFELHRAHLRPCNRAAALWLTSHNTFSTDNSTGPRAAACQGKNVLDGPCTGRASGSGRGGSGPLVGIIPLLAPVLCSPAQETRGACRPSVGAPGPDAYAGWTWYPRQTNLLHFWSGGRSLPPVEWTCLDRVTTSVTRSPAGDTTLVQTTYGIPYGCG